VTGALHLRVSRTKLLVHLAGCAGFVAVGAWLVTLHQVRAEFAGWLSIVFFGGVGVVVLKKLIVGGDRYCLSDAGVDMRSDGYGIIAWDELAAFRVVTQMVRGKPYPAITLQLRDEAKFRATLGPLKRMSVALQRALGFEPPYLGPTGLEGDAASMLQACIAEFRRRGVAERPPVTRGSD
jgi:hypothetical protein